MIRGCLSREGNEQGEIGTERGGPGLLLFFLSNSITVISGVTGMVRGDAALLCHTQLDLSLPFCPRGGKALWSYIPGFARLQGEGGRGGRIDPQSRSGVEKGRMGKGD